MSLGEEIRKALEKARANAASAQATKELDAATHDARDERRFRPAAMVLKEMAACFPRRGDIRFEDILVDKGFYSILFRDRHTYSDWSLSLRIVDLKDAYAYSAHIVSEHYESRSSVHGRFFPGREEEMVRVISGVIAHYELHGNLRQVDSVWEGFTKEFF